MRVEPCGCHTSWVSAGWMHCHIVTNTVTTVFLHAVAATMAAAAAATTEVSVGNVGHAVNDALHEHNSSPLT